MNKIEDKKTPRAVQTRDKTSGMNFFDQGFNYDLGSAAPTGFFNSAPLTSGTNFGSAFSNSNTYGSFFNP